MGHRLTGPTCGRPFLRRSSLPAPPARAPNRRSAQAELMHWLTPPQLPAEGTVVLKNEPFVMHVLCRDLAAARAMLQAALVRACRACRACCACRSAPCRSRALGCRCRCRCR